MYLLYPYPLFIFFSMLPMFNEKYVDNMFVVIFLPVLSYVDLFFVLLCFCTDSTCNYYVYSDYSCLLLKYIVSITHYGGL